MRDSIWRCTMSGFTVNRNCSMAASTPYSAAYFPGMDFAASPLYCNFMTLTICGHPHALTAEQAFIDWPQNTWGGRVRVRPPPRPT